MNRPVDKFNLIPIHDAFISAPILSTKDPIHIYYIPALHIDGNIMKNTTVPSLQELTDEEKQYKLLQTMASQHTEVFCLKVIKTQQIQSKPFQLLLTAQKILDGRQVLRRELLPGITFSTINTDLPGKVNTIALLLLQCR